MSTPYFIRFVRGTADAPAKKWTYPIWKTYQRHYVLKKNCICVSEIHILLLTLAIYLNVSKFLFHEKKKLLQPIFFFVKKNGKKYQFFREIKNVKHCPEEEAMLTSKWLYAITLLLITSFFIVIYIMFIAISLFI